MDKYELSRLIGEIREKQRLAEAEEIAKNTPPKVRAEKIRRGTEALLAERERIRVMKAEQLVAMKTRHMPRRASSNVGISRKGLVPKRGEKAGPLRD